MLTLYWTYCRKKYTSHYKIGHLSSVSITRLLSWLSTSISRFSCRHWLRGRPRSVSKSPSPTVNPCGPCRYASIDWTRIWWRFSTNNKVLAKSLNIREQNPEVLEMKMKTRTDQEKLIHTYILDRNDKNREVIMEHRILSRKTQKKWNGFWIGINESVVGSTEQGSLSSLIGW